MVHNWRREIVRSNCLSKSHIIKWFICQKHEIDQKTHNGKIHYSETKYDVGIGHGFSSFSFFTWRFSGARNDSTKVTMMTTTKRSLPNERNRKYPIHSAYRKNTWHTFLDHFPNTKCHKWQTDLQFQIFPSLVCHTFFPANSISVAFNGKTVESKCITDHSLAGICTGFVSTMFEMHSSVFRNTMCTVARRFHCFRLEISFFFPLFLFSQHCVHCSQFASCVYEHQGCLFAAMHCDYHTKMRPNVICFHFVDEKIHCLWRDRRSTSREWCHMSTDPRPDTVRLWIIKSLRIRSIFCGVHVSYTTHHLLIFSLKNEIIVTD